MKPLKQFSVDPVWSWHLSNRISTLYISYTLSFLALEPSCSTLHVWSWLEGGLSNNKQSLSGIAVASCALGTVVLSPLIQHIIQINGFRQTIRTCGIAYSTIAFISALCFKPFRNNKTSSPIHEDELECFQLETLTALRWEVKSSISRMKKTKIKMISEKIKRSRWWEMISLSISNFLEINSTSCFLL